jgi:glycosyltransferase involved in cell wall biosynthesis/peptidoglycan/xylan/chitin deacetylase (PgdA/CDA1 family)
MIDPAKPNYKDTPVAQSRPEFTSLPANPTEQPVVTIITPYYNTGSVFHETARTVLRQSFQAWEWLIINDGSTDPAALAVLDSYRASDPRIRIIDRPENCGLSAARNTGFCAARTPYVVQLDSDDLLEPTAVEKWYWFLQSHPEYSFVKGYSVGFGDQEYLWQKGFETGKAFLQENQVNATGMIRREVHQAVGGYDESNRGGLEDWDFWLKCASQGFWGATIPEFLDWYRRRASHSDRWSNWSYTSGHSVFRDQLRQRYPQLWRRGFPEIRPHWHMPNETVPDDLPCENRLQKKRPRVLMIVPWLTTGGADKFNLDLAEQLSGKGWEITIATTVQGDHSWLPAFAGYTPDIFILNHFLRMTDYPRFLRYLIQSRQVDLVLISHSELAYLLLPYLRFHCRDIPLIDYCHMEQEDWKNGGYPRMAVEYQELLNLNLVSSEHLKSWMVQRGAQASRVQVCYINIDPEKWRVDPKVRMRVRQKLGIPDELPVILFVARICPQKQPAVFANTMLRLRQQGVRFVALVAGDGPDFAWLQSFVKSHKLLDQVRLLGQVPNPEVWELMCAADLFFLPSRWEGIALSIYEAMACGLPVVGARVGGQAELVSPGCGILIEHGTEKEDVERYVEVLVPLLKTESKRKELGQAARDRVSGSFRIEQMGAQMIESFQRAIQLHQEQPRPLPSPGLARACAAEAVEYMRLFQLAEGLWQEREQWDKRSKDRPQRDRLDLRSRLYLKLYRWHEPYYRWYSSLGWTWLDPIRNGLKRLFLYGFSADELRPEDLEYRDPEYDFLVSVRVRKGQRAETEGHEPKLQRKIRSAEARALILLYHSIMPPRSDPWSLCVSPEHFEGHLQRIREWGTPLQLDELIDRLTSGTLPPNAVALTFDDGYESILSQARPLLEQYEVPATIFLPTAALDQAREFWWDELERIFLQPGNLPRILALEINQHHFRWDLGEAALYTPEAYEQNLSWRAGQPAPGPRQQLYTSLWELLHPSDVLVIKEVLDKILEWASLPPAVRATHRAVTWREVSALKDDPWIRFGSHGVSHSSLASLPIADQDYELRQSKSSIEAVTARPVTSLAYPYGNANDYSNQTAALARATGYKIALINSPGVVDKNVDPFYLPRCYVEDWAKQEFTRKLFQWMEE